MPPASSGRPGSPAGGPPEAPSGSPAGVGAAAHVFVTDLERPALDDVDAHHLARVLRLRAGELVTAGDGLGGWRRCRVRAGGRLEVDGAPEHEPKTQPTVTVAFAPVKGERPEWTVQKLTEVGVDCIVPFVAARSVVRWDAERAARQVERWRRVAREAAMQSRRAWLPDVTGLTDFDGAAALDGAALAERGGGSPDVAHPTLLVGPEGGWAADELAAGLARVSLGPNVLRAETAAIAGGFLLCALRTTTVRPQTRAGGRE